MATGTIASISSPETFQRSPGIWRGGTSSSTGFRVSWLVRVMGRPCRGMVCYGLMVIHLLTIPPHLRYTNSLLLPRPGVGGLIRRTQTLIPFRLGRAGRGVGTAGSSFILLLPLGATCILEMLVLRQSYTVGLIEGLTSRASQCGRQPVLASISTRQHCLQGLLSAEGISRTGIIQHWQRGTSSSQEEDPPSGKRSGRGSQPSPLPRGSHGGWCG